MKRFKVLKFAILLMFILIYGCSSKTDDSSKQKDNVLTKQAYAVELIHSQEPILIKRTGNVAYGKSMSLSFKTPGFVKILHKQIGSQIKKGEVLAEINLKEIEAKKNVAEYALEKAERDFERVKTLYSDSSATLTQVEDLKTKVEIAANELQIAKFNYDQSTITSPIDGKITRKFVEEGELIQPGIPVYSISSSQDLIFRTSVTDQEVSLISLGDSASVSLASYPGQKVKAIVSQIAETPNPNAGTYEIELQLRQPFTSIKEGMFGSVVIYPSNAANYVSIPIESIVEPKDEDIIIYGITDQSERVEERHVRPKYILNDQLIVDAKELTGLKKVFTRGSKFLKSGDIVKVLEE
ncbi:efflux RND transporter periplasmic adaptor subunit [Gracilimonas sp.]|uniref:efflux RND transporter periplasmic adaptor subunit n=1 Tax=Gracilimonas sp. TaxID=1974203 RepID=UPI0032EEC034